MRFSETKAYRSDIDGLRAIAVLAVIIFHFGYLPNGYLGVDVFFVISGYLITGIIYRELNENRFSIFNFYIRRARRILPLTLFLTFVSLAIGAVVMLPDDLENLAQSVIATNLFGNNILQAITTKNYWDVVNEFKPLMHTWSLGVEEQYYIVYPLLLLMIGKHHKTWLLPILTFITIVSLVLYFSPFKEYEKFYYLPFRFFELALGGIAVLYLNKKVVIHNYAAIIVGALIFILCVSPDFLASQYSVCVTVLLTLGILVSDNDQSKIASIILKNKITVAVGLISFSLYMWHQIVLAYVRYFVFQKIEIFHLVIIFFLIIILSIVTYFMIERPFRDKEKVGFRVLLTSLLMLFTLTTLPSLYIYYKGGVLRDVAELGINKEDANRDIHSKYNSQIYSYEKPFNSNLNKEKILVIGNSFARDWANVLLESKFKHLIDLSYVYDPFVNPDFQSLASKADIIFYSTADPEDVKKLGIDQSKLFVVGTKNFGINSGYFYNYRGDNYYKQRTSMEDGSREYNDHLKNEWGNKYINLIEKIIDEKGTVPVFTSEKMFISQDTRHFTKAGAMHFSRLFEDKIRLILDSAKDRE